MALSPHVAAAVTAAVMAGGSRHVVAAATAAAVRVALLFERGPEQVLHLEADSLGHGLGSEHEAKQEVAARMVAIEKVVQERVAAALEARAPRLRGVDRLRRNVASHAAFGCGADVITSSPAELRRRQRGRRRQPAHVSGGGSHEDAQQHVKVEEITRKVGESTGEMTE